MAQHINQRKRKITQCANGGPNEIGILMHF